MERLSDRAIEIINELHRERLDYESECLPLIDCANKCQAYEDTGLEPEEIIELKGQNGGAREVKRLTHTLKSGSRGIRGDVDDAVLRLAAIEDILGDLVQADREGRCVVITP